MSPNRPPPQSRGHPQPPPPYHDTRRGPPPPPPHRHMMLMPMPTRGPPPPHGYYGKYPPPPLPHPHMMMPHHSMYQQQPRSRGPMHAKSSKNNSKKQNVSSSSRPQTSSSSSSQQQLQASSNTIASSKSAAQVVTSSNNHCHVKKTQGSKWSPDEVRQLYFACDNALCTLRHLTLFYPHPRTNLCGGQSESTVLRTGSCYLKVYPIVQKCNVFIAGKKF